MLDNFSECCHRVRFSKCLRTDPGGGKLLHIGEAYLDAALKVFIPEGFDLVSCFCTNDCGAIPHVRTASLA